MRNPIASLIDQSGITPDQLAKSVNLPSKVVILALSDEPVGALATFLTLMVETGCKLRMEAAAIRILIANEAVDALYYDAKWRESVGMKEYPTDSFDVLARRHKASGEDWRKHVMAHLTVALLPGDPGGTMKLGMTVEYQDKFVQLTANPIPRFVRDILAKNIRSLAWFKSCDLKVQLVGPTS